MKWPQRWVVDLVVTLPAGKGKGSCFHLFITALLRKLFQLWDIAHGLQDLKLCVVLAL